MNVKFTKISKALIARKLNISESEILETKINATQTVFSCSVPLDNYLKAVPLKMVEDHVANEGQRNHVDRCATAQANHVKMACPPPQQASVDVIIKGKDVVNLDAFHRTLTWHRQSREQRPFDNIRLTVYVETTDWDMLDMYEVYDSPKAVRTNNHKLSSAYRIAGYLNDLRSLKVRTGKCWSAIRRMFDYKGNQVSLRELAKSAEAGREVVTFLDSLQCVADDKLQNVELVALGNAYRRTGAGLREIVVGLGEDIADFAKYGTSVTPVPKKIAGIYRKADIPLPHVSRIKGEEHSSQTPISANRSGEAVLDLLAAQLTNAILLQAKAICAGKLLPVGRRA